MKRKIITIDEEKCTGCGLCIPDCPEGALQLIDGKARLVSDLFCDGLGACLGSCPEGAISIAERQAQPYDETRVMANVVRQGRGVIRAHLRHLLDHGQDEYFREALAYLVENDLEVPAEFMSAGCRCDDIRQLPGSGCPGSRLLDLDPATAKRRTDGGGAEDEKTVGVTTANHKGEGQAAVGGGAAFAAGASGATESAGSVASRSSQLGHWPVQLMLVPPGAPFFKDADVLFAADCVPFAYPEFHAELLKGRVCLVGCPKLDDVDHYLEKITEIFRRNDIRSVTIAYMEVPCCSGLARLVEAALAACGKQMPLSKRMFGIRGASV